MNDSRAPDDRTADDDAGLRRLPPPDPRWLVHWGLLVGAVLLVWLAGRVLLLVFAGILLGVLLSWLGEFVSRWTRLPYRAAVGAVIVVLLGLFVAAGFELERRISQEIDQLRDSLPAAEQAVTGYLESSGWGRALLRQVPSDGDFSAGRLLRGVRIVGGGLLQVIAGVVVIFFVGMYGAIEPGVYRAGLLHLVPRHRRERIGEVLDQTFTALRAWMVGHLAVMSLVGVLTGVGLALLGVRAALVLGLLAALLEAVPNFGPIVAAVPALLAALAQDPRTAVYVAVLYVVVQTIESYLIQPLVQRKAVRLPPVLLIVAVVLMTLLGGALGALIATPLVVVVMVLARTLYCEDALGDHDVPKAGFTPNP